LKGGRTTYSFASCFGPTFSPCQALWFTPFNLIKAKTAGSPFCIFPKKRTRSLFDSNGVKATVSKKHNFKNGVR
jgi:hypothetical protein